MSGWDGESEFFSPAQQIDQGTRLNKQRIRKKSIMIVQCSFKQNCQQFNKQTKKQLQNVLICYDLFL